MGSLTTIDASASTATVIVTLDSDRTNHVTMGSGDDIIYFQSYRPITLDDHIDGGDGYDTVAFRQNTFTAEEYEAMRNMRNIEAIGFEGRAAVVDAAEISQIDRIIVASGLVYQDGAIVPGHNVVHNMNSGQILKIIAINEAMEDAGHVSLVNAPRFLGVSISNWVQTDGAGTYLHIEPAVDNDPRTALFLEGDAWITYDNRGGLYKIIDASQLIGGLDLSKWDSPDDEIPETGMSNLIEEYVHLGLGEDWITVEVSFDPTHLSSSTYGLLDVIEEFTSVAYGTVPHDLLYGIDRFEKFEVSSGAETLEQAFAEAAAAYQRGPGDEINVLYFQFGGDTFLYADTWTEQGMNQLDGQDFALAFIGLHEFGPDLLG